MHIEIKIIVGVLAAIAFLLIYPFVFGGGLHSDCTKCSAAHHDISTIMTNLKVNGFENGIYPKDPWGNEYQYSSYYTATHKCYIVWSLGSDGKPYGKKEHEKDIYSRLSASNCITRLKTTAYGSDAFTTRPF